MSIVGLQIRQGKRGYNRRQVFWVDGYFVGAYSGGGDITTGSPLSAQQLPTHYHIWRY